MAAATFTYPDPLARWGRDSRGLSMHVQFQYSGPNPYATGGDAIAAGAIKLGAIEYMPPVMAVNGTNAVMLVYNATTGKIMAFWCAGSGAALVEVTNGTNLSGYVATMIAEGRG